jgi:salicylate hydroxylase
MALRGRPVAVVGGGIAGLAAALALARRGARVAVFEQAPALGEVGAGLQVSPNGVAVLEALGLRETVAPHATRPEAVELVDHRRGRLVARLPLGETIEARHGRPFWQLHRADLLAALAAAAAAAGVEFRLGTAVAAVEAGGGAARLRLADGSIAEAALVVAADGVRSGLRAALDPAPARFAGHVAWRGLVPAERLPAALTRPVARVTMAPGRHLVSYPLRAGQLVNVVAIERRAAWAEEGWSTPGDPEALRRAFAGWGDPAGALLAELETCWLWGLFDHAPLARWSDGRRLVLVGDACHPMLPFLAQGATMALEDAWVLAAVLDREPDQGRALAAYTAARLPRATRVQRAAAGGGRLYHLGPGLREPAHLALSAASAVAPALLARRFDWLFGKDVTAAG